MTNLMSYSNSEKNNFDMLRLLLAFMVLFGHSFPISGNGTDPLSALLLPHEWIGSIAVHGFFAVSGFLVTASFMQRGIAVFFVSRVLRVYPAVIVFCFFAVFVVGPVSVDVGVREYYSAGAWSYFKNALLWDWVHNLPYAFQANPFSGATNGSGWTLPVELRCYLMVLVFGFFGVFDSRVRANVALSVMLFFAFFAPAEIPLLVFNGEERNVKPFIYFITGSLFWINRDYVGLSYKLALVGVSISLLALELGYLEYALPACLVYLLFVFVYAVKRIDISRVGDISFGVYLYAWPIQQMVWVPGQSPYVNALASACLVIPLAYFSWHCIEKPALGLRDRFRFNMLRGSDGESIAGRRAQEA